MQLSRLLDNYNTCDIERAIKIRKTDDMGRSINWVGKLYETPFRIRGFESFGSCLKHLMCETLDYVTFVITMSIPQRRNLDYIWKISFDNFETYFFITKNPNYTPIISKEVCPFADWLLENFDDFIAKITTLAVKYEQEDIIKYRKSLICFLCIYKFRKNSIIAILPRDIVHYISKFLQNF